MHGLGQLSLHHEVLPLEVVHRVVIQAAEGHLKPARFHLNLNLIKGRAGEHAAADGFNLKSRQTPAPEARASLARWCGTKEP
jgi:hypothetical protein